jgi:hypothetical protein
MESLFLVLPATLSTGCILIKFGMDCLTLEIFEEYTFFYISSKWQLLELFLAFSLTAIPNEPQRVGMPNFRTVRYQDAKKAYGNSTYCSNITELRMMWISECDVLFPA